MTDKQILWQQYYAAIKGNRRAEAQEILKQIHQSPSRPNRRSGGCSKCRKRLG